MKLFINAFLAAYAGIVLTACGGDSSNVDQITVKGTAAKGAMLVNRPVHVQCNGGAGETTTNESGYYEITLIGAKGPCLIWSTISDASKPIYSITAGTERVQSGNITPMTNLLVTYLQGVPGMSGAKSIYEWFNLPTTQYLLASRNNFEARVVNDFIPSIVALAPSLEVKDVSFLTTVFTISSSTDRDLETLAKASYMTPDGTLVPIVTSDGTPTATVIAQFRNSARNDAPVIVPSGATQ